MNSAYRPETHAAEVAVGTELARHVLRELAIHRGLLERLIAVCSLATASKDPDIWDALVDAAFDAMGSFSWTTSELMARTLRTDPPGVALLAAIAAAGCKLDTAKSIGVFLGRRIATGGTYTTNRGRSITRIGSDGNYVIWRVSEVSDSKTQFGA